MCLLLDQLLFYQIYIWVCQQCLIWSAIISVFCFYFFFFHLLLLQFRVICLTWGGCCSMDHFASQPSTNMKNSKAWGCDQCKGMCSSTREICFSVSRERVMKTSPPMPSRQRLMWVHNLWQWTWKIMIGITEKLKEQGI